MEDKKSKKGEKQGRKLTNAQLQRRLSGAVVHIDKTKDTRSIYFSDKGVRLTVTGEYAVIETGFHRHVFSSYTLSGVSRPYLYTERVIDVALSKSDDIVIDGGYSYARLLDVLKKNEEDKMSHYMCVYYEWWLMDIFSPLYSIGEGDAESFFVYEEYLHNVARNVVLLGERTEDITNKSYISRMHALVDEFTKDVDERVILPKKTDKEIMRENIDAMQEQETEDILSDGSKD